MIIGFCVLVLLFFIAAFFVYKDKDKTRKFPVLSIVFAGCSAFILLLVIIFTFVAIPMQGYNSNTTEYELSTFDCKKTAENGEITYYNDIYLGTNDDSTSMFYYLVYKTKNEENYTKVVINRNRDTVEMNNTNATSNKLVRTDYKLKNQFFGVWFWGNARTYTEYHFDIENKDLIMNSNDFSSLD